MTSSPNWSSNPERGSDRGEEGNQESWKQSLRHFGGKNVKFREDERRSTEYVYILSIRVTVQRGKVKTLD